MSICGETVKKIRDLLVRKGCVGEDSFGLLISQINDRVGLRRDNSHASRELRGLRFFVVVGETSKGYRFAVAEGFEDAEITDLEGSS